MADYKISGIWKDDNNVITHYAFHSAVNQRAEKVSKTVAISRLETAGNSAVTWIWSYSQAKWVNGKTVQVVGAGSNKYLRSDPDNKITDNLGHLIDYDWLQVY